MYGENYGTSTLAKSLVQLAEDVYYGMDDGKPESELVEGAKWLMDGSMVLWERLVEEAHED